MNKKGIVEHFEIPADDMKRAGEFYKRVFGWQITDMSMPDMEYHSVRSVDIDKDNKPVENGVINGGMMKRMTDEGTMIVITVDDINQSMKEVVANGGKEVMPKMPVADMGFYSRIKDSEGNLIGLWEHVK